MITLKTKPLLFLFFLLQAIGMSAKITVTRLTCNNQADMAIVANGGGEAIIFGWQMSSDCNNDYQTAYQLEIVENGTNKTVYAGKKVKSEESQLVKHAPLPENSHGYRWRVRVWDAKKQASDWSQWQLFYVAPTTLNPVWVGAISKREAKIPDGKWPNTSFKKQDFKDAWKDADSLSTKSIDIFKTFRLTGTKSKISNAVIYVSGLGHYILDINGKKVSDAEFAPLWTDYNKTVYYNIYDVTSEIANEKSDADCHIHALLGNGMYNVQKDGRYAKFQASYGAPKLFFRLVINYADGRQQVVETDGSEKYRLSDIVFNSIYGGDSADYTNANSQRQELNEVKIVEPPVGKLLPQTAPPVKIMERFNVKSWNYTDSTRTTIVCDMGQNLSGFPEITLSYGGAAVGQESAARHTVKLTVSEKLNKEGLCDQKQTGRPYFYSITVPQSSQKISWHPHFSYYGFRYIQVEGAVMKGEPNPNNLPVIDDIKSCFIYNSAEEYSAFESSNPIFTQAHRLIERAERSNMQSVFTDCPHREKLGWLEQDNLCGPSLLYNYDLTTYGPKFIHDICDAQKADGNVPTIAPQYVEFGNHWGDFDQSPEWGSTLIIFPFQYYEQYGDNSLIIKNYDAMCRYTDYLTSRADGGIVSFGLGDWYDYQPDGEAGFSKNTPVPLVATAHYIYDLQLMVKAAQMKNDKGSEEKYSALLTAVVDAFNHRFFNADSCYYGNNSQCSNALPLFLGICPEGTANKVYENLVADVMKSGKPRLTTGDVGNRYLIQALSQQGNDQLVYDMFNHEETPGYAFQIKQGMTTLSEQWNPQFGTSLNHFMMGQIDEWLFKSMAGIRNAEGSAGLKKIIIKPFFTEGLGHIYAKTKNLYGAISVDATPTSMTVEVPMGCTATVIFPNGKSYNVGSGKHIVTLFQEGSEI